MTPRERILTTLAHQRPDRIPTDGWFHPEIMAALKRHFRTADWSAVLRELGVEGWGRVDVHVRFPAYEVRATPRPKAPVFTTAAEERSAAPPDAQVSKYGIWLDHDTYEDQWGVRHRLGQGGRYEEWLSGPLQDAQSATDVGRYLFPTPAQVIAAPDLAQQVAGLKREQKFVYGVVDNAFKQHWFLRGYENALMDYLDSTDVLEAVYERLFPLYTEMAVQLARAGVDMIQVVGDVSMQDRIIMGPEPWRRFDKPRWAALIDAVHAVKKDVAFFFHSDGNLTDLVDDLVEIGFTIINPIQPECMDPVAVKQRWGKRITLHGCISLQRTLPFGTPGDVRAEVEGLIRHCGHDGGLILMPSNVIQPDTPLENVLTCYRAVREFDWGTIR